jgi:hypothetical protein
MSLVNSALRGLFDVILLPARFVPELVSLAVISLVVGIAMLIVFKRTSNQAAIAATKAKLHAGVFEIRLFNDDLVQILRAQGSVLKHNLRYLGLSSVPLLWMIVPFVLMIAQLHSYYGYRGFTPGDELLLKVELADDWRASLPQVDKGARPPVELLPTGAITVETPAVWLPSLNEVAWRVQAAEAGDWELGIRIGDETYGKSFRVGDGFARRSPLRHAGGLYDAVLHPSEDPLPAGPVSAIQVEYPDTGMWALGMARWLWIFFVLSMVFAFALKDRFGVTI